MSLVDEVKRYEDIPLTLTFSLAHTKVKLRDVLRWKVDDIVETKKNAGEYIDIKVNGQPFGNGEVVVIDEKFSIRVVTIYTKEELMSLNIK